MKTTTQPDPDTIRTYVRERYGEIAEHAGEDCGCAPSCCAPSGTKAARRDADRCCGDIGTGASDGERLGYSATELAAAPEGSNLGLGCGNPIAIASIRPGETVVDLGSGAGFDCFLAARQLAGTGRVIGVDMTPAMIERARANAARSGLANVEFRLGEIESLPVADASADLVISNCVINLSPEKERVFREAFRVLKPGGRFAVADIVATRPLPDEIRTRLDSIGACVGGATPIDELRRMLAGTGFSRIEVSVRAGSGEMISEWTGTEETGEMVVSALITAYKD